MKNISADVEVIGNLVRAVVVNQNYKNIEELVRKHNLHEIDDEKWYKVADVVALAEAIVISQQSFSSVFDMVAIGKATSEVAAFPPEVTTIEQFLAIQNDILPMLYRGENIGYVKVIPVEKHNYLLHINLAWPADILYGSYYGFAKRFLPLGTGFTVSYEPTLKQHPDEVVIRIKWQDNKS